MKHPVSHDLHSYWDMLRAGRTAPERSDIDPAAIRHLLAYTFVLDVSADVWTTNRQIAFRLSGTRLNALFRRELKGCGFQSIWASRDLVSLETMLDATLDDRAPAVASVRGAPPDDRAIDLELLLLPLRHHGKTHARILGSLAASETPGWMGLRVVEPLTLRSFRCMLDRLPRGEQTTVVHPADRRPVPFDKTFDLPSPGPARIGSFKVYEGGRRIEETAGTDP